MKTTSVDPELPAMHVFFDDQIFHTQIRGGISRYITEVATALKNENLATPHIFGGYSRNQQLADFARQNPAATHYIPRRDQLRINSLVKNLSAAWRKATYYQLAKDKRPFIYHPSFYQIDPFIQKRAEATVITVHDMIAELFPTPSKHSVRHIAEKKQAITQADHIFTVSKSTRNDLLQFFPEISPDTITVTPLGPGLMAPPVPPTRYQPRPYYLHVGHRDGYKNGMTLINAFIQSHKKIEEVDLILCGPTLRSEEQELISKQGVQGKITQIRASDIELQTLYTHALALIFPSAYEGFGLPLLEAQLHGCPVITCPVSSLSEVAGNAAIYTPAGDVAALADTLVALASDEALRTKLSKQGLAQAAQFNWPRTARLTTSGYATALSLK
jgi:glycosyltransferase involved in cell wall biosynthesis